MGCSKKKHQLEVKKDSDNKRWVIAGISLRSPLKPISTTTTKAVEGCCEDENGACSTTPTARESKIPEILTCPPAPRKRRPSSTCHLNGVVDFFNPPDLESVFIYRAERAK